LQSSPYFCGGANSKRFDEVNRFHKLGRESQPLSLPQQGGRVKAVVEMQVLPQEMEQSQAFFDTLWLSYGDESQNPT